MKHLHTNIVRIKAVHEILGDLRDKVVLVGGTTIFFCTLYLSTENYRELFDEDLANLTLFIDLIHSKSLAFREERILFLEVNERYQLAKIFLVTWQGW